MKLISLLIATTAILLLIALISVQADATVDSYKSTPVSTTIKPTKPVDKYQKPRKICKKKCLLHKYIKGKCLKHKLVGQKKVCDQYAIVGAGRCLKYKKYSKCDKYSKPTKKCVLHGYKRTTCAKKKYWKVCDPYGTKTICLKRASKKYCAKRKYVSKCVKHAHKKICKKFKKVPIKKCEKKKVCDKYTVDSYAPKKCRYIKKCKIVSFAKKCCKWKKVKYCKEKKSFKKFCL